MKHRAHALSDGYDDCACCGMARVATECKKCLCALCQPVRVGEWDRLLGKLAPMSHSAGYAFTYKRGNLERFLPASGIVWVDVGSLDAAASHGSTITLAIGRQSNAKANGFHTS
jgi:hypothetical protein